MKVHWRTKNRDNWYKARIGVSGGTDAPCSAKMVRLRHACRKVCCGVGVLKTKCRIWKTVKQQWWLLLLSWLIVKLMEQRAEKVQTHKLGRHMVSVVLCGTAVTLSITNTHVLGRHMVSTVLRGSVGTEATHTYTQTWGGAWWWLYLCGYGNHKSEHCGTQHHSMTYVWGGTCQRERATHKI